MAFAASVIIRQPKRVRTKTMLTDQSQDNVVSKFNIIDFFSNMFLSNVLKKKQVLVFIYPSI